jgi:TolB protein
MNKQNNFFLHTAMLLMVVMFNSSLFAQKTEYKIVYNVLEDKAKDNYDVYSMNMDGSDKRNITNTPGVEWVYYAYKDKVYYVSDIDTCHRCYFLYEMDAEGNGKRKLSNLQVEDSWMSRYDIATGEHLFVMGRIGKTVRNQLFLVNIKDGSFTQITNDTISTKRDPLYIPGSGEIIMAYRPDKALRKTIPDELWKLSYNTKADGPQPFGIRKIQLTHFPKEDTTTQWFEYHAGPPQWNRKYKFISYLSRQKGQHQIYAVTPDGKKHWQITAGEIGSGWHSWSSDGKWLAMDKAGRDEKQYDIYLMNYKTKKTIQLTSGEKYEQAPVIVEMLK